MPTKSTVRKARTAARQGKSASTQAGEFVRDEIHKVRKGKHGARSAKQAIAIGLSEARRSGVKVPEKSEAKAGSRSGSSRTASKSSTAKSGVAKSRGSASTSSSRSQSAKKATRTKGAEGASRATKKGARTRSINR